MKKVRKKSIDAATNEMLVRAHRTKTEVIWDRADALQPQCGFGRMNLCCMDCCEGPCRINPFDENSQQTICGRTRKELISYRFLKQVTDGSAALLSLCHEFGSDFESSMVQTICMTNDSMLAPTNYTMRMLDVGQTTAKALISIGTAKEKIYGKAEPNTVATNMGTLKADAVNIVLLGHVAPRIVQALMNKASSGPAPLNITAVCGSEAGGRLPVSTNYDSQEMLLVTGGVDLLIIGSQCVMPATVSLAKDRNIAVMPSSVLNVDKAIDEVIETAVRAFERRQGKDLHIPCATEPAFMGYTAANTKQLFNDLKAAADRNVVMGIIYLGGCGNVSNTQDAGIVQTAAKLISQGYLIVTAGCAGAALAKAGMCTAEYAFHHGLTGISEMGIPPVLHIGSCHDAGQFLVIAQNARSKGIPVFSVMQEINHNKVLATAVAFATEGIKTYVDMGEMADLPVMKLPGGMLLMSELEQVAPKSTNVAVAQ